MNAEERKLICEQIAVLNRTRSEVENSIKKIDEELASLKSKLGDEFSKGKCYKLDSGFDNLQIFRILKVGRYNITAERVSKNEPCLLRGECALSAGTHFMLYPQNIRAMEEITPEEFSRLKREMFEEYIKETEGDDSLK